MGTGVDRGSGAHADGREFEEILSAIGYGHAYRRAPEPEDVLPPDRPVDEPPPLERPKRPASRRRRNWVAGVLTGSWVLATVVSLTVWPMVSERGAPARAESASGNSAVSPFFSLEAFRRIRPGISAAEVRDLVGLPLTRQRYTEAPDGEYWAYMAPFGGQDAALPTCAVWLSAGRVLATKELPPLPFQAEDYFVMLSPFRRVGDLTLKLQGGRELTLRAADPTPCVLAGPACDVPPDGRPVSRDSVLRLGEPMARAGDGSRFVLPPMSVYSRGGLYLVPNLSSDLPQSTRNEDLQWLLARLEPGQ